MLKAKKEGYRVITTTNKESKKKGLMILVSKNYKAKEKKSNKNKKSKVEPIVIRLRYNIKRNLATNNTNMEPVLATTCKLNY